MNKTLYFAAGVILGSIFAPMIIKKVGETLENYIPDTTGRTRKDYTGEKAQKKLSGGTRSNWDCAQRQLIENYIRQNNTLNG